jgi:Cu(I)/Ag(I) efflux system periplasmic protein CusF
MKNEFIFALSLFWLALGGCVAYRMPQLPLNHPAHPEAEEAVPASSVSRTLAYTLTDVGSAQRTVTLASQEGGHEGHHQPEVKQAVVDEGKIVATVPNANQLVVEHGEIKDFMGPMTMGYRIDSPSLLEGLKSGDKIRFTIDVQTKSIVKIEKLNE